ncbi:MAG: hypothetical protein QF662_05450, partial [Phycisphaerae bacterium]|nr:hypothetical protein [Phycisphaerae bacterium]
AWAAWQMTFDVGKEIVASGSALPDYRPFGYGDYYPLKLYGDLNKPARIMSPKELMKRLSGVHVAPTAKYVLHRSPEAFSVYSWHGFSANGGLLTRDPVALNTGGDGGGVLVRSKREKDNKSVEDSLGSRSWAKTTVHGPVVEDDGFSIVVRRETKHGITNYTACVSLPGCNTVLVSRTIADEDMEVDMLRMGRKTFLLKQNPAALAKHGLKKWPWWGDHKIYLPEDKELKFGGSWRRAELNPRPAWVNVGNRMGYVPIGTSATIGAGGRTIVFECYNESRQIKAGGEVGRIILVTFPGVTAAETAQLVAEVRTLAAVPEGVYAVRIPKVRGIAAPVWVVVNFRDEAVNLTLPSEAGRDAKVTVKGNSCATFGLRPTSPPRPARKTLFTRKNYDAVEVGMDKARVKRALGEPTQKFVNVFIYLDEDPMGNAEAHVYFDAAGKVVGKRYDDSAKPAETSRVGNVPK